MLYRIALIQIFIYLVAVPAVRVVFYQVVVDYAWVISFAFIGSFLVAGNMFYFFKNKIPSFPGELINFRFSKVGALFLFVWVAICLIISIQFGLYNRRIGTENAAELFAGIPTLVLMVFRSLEISMPMLMAVMVIKVFDGHPLSRLDICISIALIIAFFSLGAANSRSATGLFLVIILVISQNRIPRRLLNKTIGYFLLFGVIFFLGVTAIRSVDDVGRSFDEYFSAEVVQRLDGLEVVSEIVSIHGYQLLGINPSAALIPLIALVPFLDEAVQLKANALTSVKAVMLERELGSELRDINSFVVLDAYYLGGFIGVVIVGFIIGLLARWVDLYIGRRVGVVLFVGMVSIASNLLIIEREALGMTVSMFRDFIILFFVFRLVFYSGRNIMLRK